MPTTYFVDRGGKVAGRHSGFNPSKAPEEIEKQVKRCPLLKARFLDEGAVLVGEPAVLAPSHLVERVAEVTHDVELVEDHPGVPTEGRQRAYESITKELDHLRSGALVAVDSPRPPPEALIPSRRHAPRAPRPNSGPEKANTAKHHERGYGGEKAGENPRRVRKPASENQVRKDGVGHPQSEAP